MKQLLLFRHAKSSWDHPDLSDHQRPLSARGREAAPVMGRWMAGRDLVPDRVLCSSALRTRQTLELASRAWTDSPEVFYLDELYLAGVRRLLELIRRHGANSSRLMLIGHNPGLEMLAGALASEASEPDRTRLQTKFPTAALAVIAFSQEDWAAPDTGHGRLTHFIWPRDLEAG